MTTHTRPRRHPHGSPRARHLVRWLGNLAYVALGGAILLTAGALALALSHIPAGRAAPRATANVTANVARAPLGDGWIPLKSQSPVDILAAARQSPLFAVNRTDGGDHQQDLSRLGAPVLVSAVQPARGAPPLPDFYIVPILDASGAATAAAELQLSPARDAINVIAIVTYAQPHPAGAIARQTASAAAATVASRAHVAPRAGAAPRLVYFAGDAQAQEMGTVVWTAGGQSPADPIWLVPGSDGQDRLAGNDGKVYRISQLPMDPNG